jgi:Spy/CpxP family protein refolding chaperone
MKLTKRNLTLAALAIFTVFPVMADQAGPRGRMMGAPKATEGPGPMGGRGLNFLAGYLNLTESQKAEAKAIFDASAVQAQTLQGSMAAARNALQTAVKSSATDAEIDRLAAAVGVVHGQLVAVQSKSAVKFRAILTAEQRTKLDEFEGRRGRRGPAAGE